MTYANVGHILLKRGNTSQSNSYTGPVGELTLDTGLFAIRLHNGVTPGGNVLLENASQFTANLGTAAANITTLFANAATQTTLINAINANVTAANAAITSLTSNAAIQASLLDTLTGNAATQAQVLDTLTSNAATQSISLTTLLSNAATQQTSLTDLVANAAAQAQAIANAAGTYGNANVDAYIGANIGTLYSNAATQATSINAITANIGSFYTYANLNYGTSSYANANVAGYLGSQNITSANIGGSQTYANTQVNTVNANLGAYQTFANLTFSTVANAATQATSINTVNANLGAYQTYGNLTFSTVANAASLAADITTLLANAATQASSITTLQTQVYANANVATYLPTYTGNIAGNIVKSGYTWTFSNTGTTTFPTGVRLSNARGANTVNFTTDIDKSFQIETQTSTTSRLWSFGTDGNLTLPQFANINFSNGVNILSTVGATYGNTQVAEYLPTYSGNIAAGNLTITGNLDQPNRGFGNGPGTNLYITAGHTQGCSIPGGNTIISGGLGYNGIAWNGGNVTLRTGDYYSKQWNFDYAGNLTIPGNINFANGVNILSTVTYGNTQANALLSSNTVSTISTTGNITTIANVIATGNVYGSTFVGNVVASGNNRVGNLITTGNLYGNVVGTTGVYSGDVSINGVTTLAGNLGVDGTQATIFDSIIGLHTYANLTPWAADDGRDIGIRMHYYNAADKHAFLGLENTSKTLQFIIDATETASNTTGTFGNVRFGSLFLSNTTTSTTTTTGALIVSGGAGFAGNVFANNIVANVTPAITSTPVTGVGYLGMPQNATGTATLTIADAGRHVYVTTTGQTITIPANSSVAYPIGTAIAFIGGPSATTTTIAITTDTMYLAGTGTTGTRTLAAYGMATAVKVAATTWYINGSGLT